MPVGAVPARLGFVHRQRGAPTHCTHGLFRYPYDFLLPKPKNHRTAVYHLSKWHDSCHRLCLPGHHCCSAACSLLNAICIHVASSSSFHYQLQQQCEHKFKARGRDLYKLKGMRRACSKQGVADLSYRSTGVGWQLARKISYRGQQLDLRGCTLLFRSARSHQPWC